MTSETLAIHQPLPNKFDDLDLFGLREDPEAWEALILNEIKRANNDPIAKQVLESTYWESDREIAFERFFRSRDFQTIHSLLQAWGVDTRSPMVEIGAGSGFLAWALHRSGFQNVSLLEPNSNWVTGTGYLRSRTDASNLQIENSLESWYESPTRYRHVLTRNCIHHFPNMTLVAACIRAKLEPQGNWFAIRESFADSPHEWYRFMQSHPFSQKYKVFEFACPSSQYVSSIELAGFKLKGVVPAGYENDCLSLYSEAIGSKWNQRTSTLLSWILRRQPKMTVAAYRLETSLPQRLRNWLRWFTRPQVLWFQRVELGDLPEHTLWYSREL
jgi:hypothetical protein